MATSWLAARRAVILGVVVAIVAGLSLWIHEAVTADVEFTIVAAGVCVAVVAIITGLLTGVQNTVTAAGESTVV